MDQDGWVDTREQSRVQWGKNDVYIDEYRPSAVKSEGMDKLKMETMNIYNSQLAEIGPLVAHNNLVKGRIVAGKPWITKQMMNAQRNTDIPRGIQYCVWFPSPPVAMGMKVGFASQFWPQVQVIISEMLQEVVAAYQVYGLNAAISAGVSGEMPPWRGSSVEGVVGRARMLVTTETRVTRRANREVKAMMVDRAGLVRLDIVKVPLYGCS